VQNTFQWLAVVGILAVTFAGGCLPLFRGSEARRPDGFPNGEAFTSGVFLALSLLLMGPAAVDLTHAAFPGVNYPLVGAIMIGTFLFLLGLEHFTRHMQTRAEEAGQSSAIIPIIMTTMIAIPSFFLGMALGLSRGSTAVLLLVAIVVHKSSAAFALALKMVRSSLTRNETLVLFTVFAFSTPLGIVFGDDVQRYVPVETIKAIKGIVLAMAAGVFLYMSTVHELQNAPMIRECGKRRGYAAFIVGVLVTALVRWIIGEAHHL
jgi:zinc transporter ZupT